MDFFKNIIDVITNGLISDIDKVIKKNKEKMEITKMTGLKSLNALVFVIAFLLANFTSMIVVLLKDILGYGLVFPVSSCILLYIICIGALRNMYLFNKEREFFVKKIEYDKNEENKQ